MDYCQWSFLDRKTDGIHAKKCWGHTLFRNPFVCVCCACNFLCGFKQWVFRNFKDQSGLSSVFVNPYFVFFNGGPIDSIMAEFGNISVSIRSIVKGQFNFFRRGWCYAKGILRAFIHGLVSRSDVCDKTVFFFEMQSNFPPKKWLENTTSSEKTPSSFGRLAQCVTANKRISKKITFRNVAPLFILWIVIWISDLN